MERIKRYTDIIQNVMNDFIQKRKDSVKGLTYEMILDHKNLRYQLILMGWHNEERIHHLVFHIDIINDKIWIQEDNTEIGIANSLVEKGISKKEIILAYFSEFHRQFTEFAVN